MKDITIQGRDIEKHSAVCKYKWILCPICGNKTRVKVLVDTVLENFPLFCPKCKKETLINVKNQRTSVNMEPDA